MKEAIILRDERFKTRRHTWRIIIEMRNPYDQGRHYVICHYINDVLASTFYAGVASSPAVAAYNNQLYTLKVMRDIGI